MTSVLFVLHRGFGREVYGGEKSTIATACALRDRGIATHFLVTAEDGLAAEIRNAGLTCEVVPIEDPFAEFRSAPLSNKLRRAVDLLRVNRAVAASVRARGVDVVNASLIPSLACAWLGARVGGARVVYHVRTASRGQRTRLQEEIAMLISDRTVAVSPSLREQLVGTARRWLRPVLAPRVTVIPNGFDFAEIDRFMREQSASEARRVTGPEPGRPSLLHVGSIFVDKGQLRFIENVLPRVIGAVPDLHLAFAGGAKDADYAAACRAAVAHLGIERNVSFLGYLPQREVYRRYLACDLVVLPSEREGLPRCAIEAQAFGRPIVATAVVGTVDAIRHGETGFLVPSRSIEEMAEPIVRLARDAALRQRLGMAGARHVRDRFQLEENAAAIARVVRELGARRRWLTRSR